jgi:hypothetical protein
MTVMIVAVFPSIQSSSQLDELIKAYPDALKEAFGITDASLQHLGLPRSGELQHDRAVHGGRVHDPRGGPGSPAPSAAASST